MYGLNTIELNKKARDLILNMHKNLSLIFKSFLWTSQQKHSYYIMAISMGKNKWCMLIGACPRPPPTWFGSYRKLGLIFISWFGPLAFSSKMMSCTRHYWRIDLVLKDNTKREEEHRVALVTLSYMGRQGLL